MILQIVTTDHFLPPFPYPLRVILDYFVVLPTHSWPQFPQCGGDTRRQGSARVQESWRVLEVGPNPAVWSLSSLWKETEGALPDSHKMTFNKPFMCLFPPKWSELLKGPWGPCIHNWSPCTQPGSLQSFGICQRTGFVFSANLSGTVLAPYAVFPGMVIV